MTGSPSVWGAAVLAPSILLVGVGFGLAHRITSTQRTWVWLTAALCAVLGGVVQTGGLRAPLEWLANRLPPQRLALVLVGVAGATVLVGQAWGLGNHAVALAVLPASVALVFAGSALARGPLSRKRAAALVVGAALLAVLLRGLLVVAFPTPLLYPDSATLLSGAHGLLAGEGFTQHPSRTPLLGWVYGLGVGAGGLLGARLLLLLVGLATPVCLGLALRRRAPVVAAVVFTLLVLDPRTIYYETIAVAEVSLGLFLLLAALALTRATDAEDGDLRWLLAAGLLVGAATLAKPVAQAALLLGGLVVVATVRPWKRTGLAVLVYGAGALLPILAWCARNLAVEGFFGLTLFTGTTLMGVTAHLVVLDSPLEAEAKQRMRPAIERYLALDDLDEIDFVMYDPRGACAQLSHLPLAERDRILRAVALEGIRAAPHRYAYSVLHRGRRFLRPEFHPSFLLPFGEELARQVRFQRSLLPRAETRRRYARPPLPSAWTTRAAAWDGATAGLRVVNAVIYPLLMAVHLLALLGAVWIGRREVWIPLLMGWAILFLTAVGNRYLERYLVGVTPLFLLAAGQLVVAWRQRVVQDAL